MANTKDSAVEILKSLENASQEHETNVVIELGTDRTIKWIGVYVLLTLAGLVKINEILGKKTAAL